MNRLPIHPIVVKASCASADEVQFCIIVEQLGPNSTDVTEIEMLVAASIKIEVPSLSVNISGYFFSNLSAYFFDLNLTLYNAVLNCSLKAYKYFHQHLFQYCFLQT
jgi:hypothetical protein